MQDVTIIIKTFERPESLYKLVKSIRKHYGNIKILVANDGKKSVEGDFDVYTMPYDSGLSAGRNLLLSQVQTPYFVLMDDDFLVDEFTNLDLMRKQMTHYDLVGGNVKGHSNYHGKLELKGGVLTYKRGEPLDIVLNFFMAHTDKVRQIGWDNSLKLAEHTDFFLRAKGKLKIGFNPDCTVGNTGEGDDEYKHMRRRGSMFLSIFMQKHGIKKIINFEQEEQLMETSLPYERIDGVTPGPSLDIHKYRYEMAGDYTTSDDVILDAACGVGYGAKYLHGEYVGVDKEDLCGNIVADLQTWTPDFEYDVFISFETIEHLEDYSNLMKIAHQAKKYIIVSAPIVPTKAHNPYHLHDFTFDELKDLFKDDKWKIIHEETQKVKGRDLYGVLVLSCLSE